MSERKMDADDLVARLESLQGRRQASEVYRILDAGQSVPRPYVAAAVQVFVSEGDKLAAAIISGLAGDHAGASRLYAEAGKLGCAADAARRAGDRKLARQLWSDYSRKVEEHNSYLAARAAVNAGERDRAADLYARTVARFLDEHNEFHAEEVCREANHLRVGGLAEQVLQARQAR